MIINKHIAEGFSKGELYDVLVWLAQSGIGIQGEVYYVENNAGSDGNDGSCWDKAFKTLTYALAVSHANIAASSKGWAARNTIFCKGDAIDEDLTKFAQKTNVIGVGSCDDCPQTRILGTHVSEAQSTADYMGCHFYNIEFKDDGASSNITIPADQNGIEIHNCTFTVNASGTYAITATSLYRLRIINCRFKPDGDGNKFATAAILLAGTTSGGIEIVGNTIFGTIGIDCNCTNAVDGLVKDNLIVATTFPIDDESDDLIVINNRMITAADATTLETCLDINLLKASGNRLASAHGSIEVPALTTYA